MILYYWPVSVQYFQLEPEKAINWFSVLMLACLNRLDKGASLIWEWYFKPKALLFLMYIKNLPFPQILLYHDYMKTLLTYVLQNSNLLCYITNNSMIQWKLYSEYWITSSTSKLANHWYMHHPWWISYYTEKWSYKTFYLSWLWQYPNTYPQ